MNAAHKLSLYQTSHPIVYEVNTRVLLRELSEQVGKKISLATIPDRILDEWSSLGFDAIWLMGVWAPSIVGRELALAHDGLMGEFRRSLPDVKSADVVASPYAVKSYTPSTVLGGTRGLSSVRRKLNERGMALILDFVPNHTARDHLWVSRQPELYVRGDESDLRGGEFFKATSGKRVSVIAHGKDPHFSAWTDTAQLDYRLKSTWETVSDSLVDVAGLCDGVRCDMAMLLLEDVFEKTWKDRPAATGERAEGEFWTHAITRVREKFPSFLFIAEAYWNLEWKLQELGFDFTYDKRLYDRLLREGAAAVFEHLKADEGYQRKSVRFIENHDEVRAAYALSPEAWHCAAAVIAFTVPGMALLHDGQLEGRRTKVPVQLNRRAREEPSALLKAFYMRLLQCVKSRPFIEGRWELLTLRSAWNENHTWTNFLSFWWTDPKGGSRLVVVNYAPHNGQCYVDMNFEGTASVSLEFRDMMSDAVFVRDRASLATKGMYFDLPGYGFHIFDVSPATP